MHYRRRGMHMKMDVGLSVEGKHLPRMEEVGRVAEEIGFSGLWTSETKHDSFLPLVVAATRTQRIQLGNAVAVAFSRSDREEHTSELQSRQYLVCRLLLE